MTERDERGFTERDYYWTDQALSDAAHAEAQKREQSRRWREEASKPSVKPSDMLKRTTKRVKHLTKNMNQLGEAARQATEALEAFSPGHLTQRPFHTLEMIAFREILQDQTK